MKKIISVIIAVAFICYGAYTWLDARGFLDGESHTKPSQSVSDIKNIPEYDGYSPYVELNGNNPSFTEEDKETLGHEGYEYYSSLDSLGRCGYAEANVSMATMPLEGESRGSIGMVKPSGWHTVKSDRVSGKYVYNRCHLIGWQLTAENANDANLITGTRYMNVEGQLPFEDEVADYVRNTGNHVMYRVTPIYEGDNLVASGVQMEAQSVEDNEISFNVYCYNVQPGITIDYSTGEAEEE